MSRFEEVRAEIERYIVENFGSNTRPPRHHGERDDVGVLRNRAAWQGERCDSPSRLS